MLLSSVLIALSVSAPASDSESMVRATIQKNVIYVSGVTGTDSNTKRVSGGGKLWLQKMSLGDNSEINSLDYMFSTSYRPEALLRWQVRNGQYYCVTYSTFSGFGGSTDSATRFGHLNRVSLSAIESANASRKEPKFYPDVFRKYRESIELGPHLTPVGMATAFRSEGVQLNVYFDFWCQGDHKLEVYVAPSVFPFPDNLGLADRPRENDRRLIRADFYPERKIRGDQDPMLQWEVVGEWTHDWSGPFYIAVSGDDRYFVTDTGRVFGAPRAGGRRTALKELWKGKPVEALIHDADSAKWYAFTKAEYFEVAEPFRPIAHTLTIRRSKIADEALAAAAKCGRAIRGIPEPKSK
jgi:hypothetical protein